MSDSGSAATNQAWDQTYQSDIAQEKQLKSGGKSSASSGAASGETGSKMAPAEKMAPAQKKLPPKGSDRLAVLNAERPATWRAVVHRPH
jgi:hypothetical protein